MIASARATTARGGLRRGLGGPVPLMRARPVRRWQAAGDGGSQGATVPALSSADFDDHIGSGYHIIDCYTDWCGPCKMIAPKFAELADAHAEAPITFRKYDCQSDPKRSSALGIKALPSFLAFKDGVEVGRMVGSKKDELERFVEEHRAAAEAASAGAAGAGAAVPAAAAVVA